MQPALPARPSTLLALGLSNLGKTATDHTYAINMGVWHYPTTGVCQVCFAGCTLAQTLKWSPKVPLNWSSIATAENQARLRALDAFRRGWVTAGLRWLGVTSAAVGDVVITAYGTSAAGFEKDLMGLVGTLAKAGL